METPQSGHPKCVRLISVEHVAFSPLGQPAVTSTGLSTPAALVFKAPWVNPRSAQVSAELLRGHNTTVLPCTVRTYYSVSYKPYHHMALRC